jgi:hypothetical protein
MNAGVVEREGSRALAWWEGVGTRGGDGGRALWWVKGGEGALEGCCGGGGGGGGLVGVGCDEGAFERFCEFGPAAFARVRWVHVFVADVHTWRRV